jgi:SAM-dependent methyltransferase
MMADHDAGGWRPRFVCPACSAPLDHTATGLGCPSCSADYDCRAGIHRLLAADRLVRLRPFFVQYRHVRQRDGYRSDDPDYYRRLPEVDDDHPQADIWRVRRDTYTRLRRRVLARFGDRPLAVLDLGAGSGWLSHRLAALGHRAVALDWLDDAVDGLGVWPRYPSRFVRVQADFDRLPFAPAQFDLVVFNGSLHYAPDVVASVTTAGRLVAPGGALLVMDSPTFRRAADGRAMLERVEQRFRSEYGLDDMVRPGTGYVTFADLWRAAGALGLRSRFFRSSGGLGWSVRRLVGGLKMRRGPAAFGLWVAT